MEVISHLPLASRSLRRALGVTGGSRREVIKMPLSLTKGQIDIAHAIADLRRATRDRKVNTGYILGFTRHVTDALMNDSSSFDQYAFLNLCVPAERERKVTR